MKLTERICGFASHCRRGSVFGSVATVISVVVVGFGMSACNDDVKPSVPDIPGQETIESEWTTASARVSFLSQVDDGDFNVALRECFPNVSDLSGASVAVVSGNGLKGAIGLGLKEFYDRGGLVVVTNPNDDTDDIVEEFFADGYCPLVDSTDAILFAFNNRDKYYTIATGSEVTEGGTTNETDQALLDELIGKADEEETPGWEEDTINEDEAEAHEHNEDYFHQRMESFVNWVNRIYDASGPVNEPVMALSRGSDSYDPRVNISNDYVEVYHSFPVSLHNRIDKGTRSKEDRLDCDTDIEYNYRIYPLYLFSSNGGDAPGDYYIVEGSVTAHNGRVWNPYNKGHGGCNDRVVGYYMKSLTSKYELVKRSGDSYDTLDGLRFYHDPTPGTTMGSTTYTSGFTAEFNGSLSGSYGQSAGFGGQLSLGFACQWSKSTSQTLADVMTELTTESSDKSITYRHTVQNIHNKRNWGKWDRDYPLLSRNDMTCNNAWVWKVPYGKNGVSDNVSTSFSVRISMSAKYGAFNWWRGASWDNEQTFDVKAQSCVVEIKAPNRSRFGVFALRNASSKTVAHINIWKQEDAVDGEYPADKIHATIPSSYNSNEVAKWKLREGQYHIEFDIVDPNDGNKVVSRWKYDNVKVTMGRDEYSATTEVSTVDAVKID